VSAATLTAKEREIMEDQKVQPGNFFFGDLLVKLKEYWPKLNEVEKTEILKEMASMTEPNLWTRIRAASSQGRS
jgi:hypothetical protein